MVQFAARLALLGSILLLAAVPQIASAQEKPDVRRDIVYSRAGEQDLKLDLYLPEGDGPHPIAVFLHGGGWIRGGKAMGKPICSALATRGYLAASVDYRLAETAPWPAQIEDCQAAVTWLQAHGREYGGDPAQFVVTGGSAGGQLALSLSCGWGATGGSAVDGVPQERRWPESPIRACCSWYGPADLAGLGQVSRVSSNLQAYLGHTLAERAIHAPQASPILYVDSHDPPVLLIHGTRDPVVSINQSRRMHRALRDAGVTTELIEVRGGSHGTLLAGPKELAKLRDRMIDWFDVQLGRD